MAAEKWATEANIPVLVELLKSAEPSNRRNVLEALGATGGDQKTADMIAKLLDTDARWEASDALKLMPKYAEVPTLPFLESENSETRRYACEVLESVGGKQSMKALLKLKAKIGDGGIEGFAIKRALEASTQRAALQSDEN
jgi:HEAT repeat protein